uniref:Uncharacterized protein n=1 Tax=Rhizophora mucronata TaxID=61149 RepID=A0A2P2PT06_RHIMU
MSLMDARPEFSYQIVLFFHTNGTILLYE